MSIITENALVITAVIYQQGNGVPACFFDKEDTLDAIQDGFLEQIGIGLHLTVKGNNLMEQLMKQQEPTKLTFLEGGNAWNSFWTYNPFQRKRSAGFGIRVYMGEFGLIGFDFAYGFDKPLMGTDPSGWKTHFLMNQSL